MTHYLAFSLQDSEDSNGFFFARLSGNYLLDDGEASHNDAAMILLATDLNGHLRAHPKRVAFMPHPGQTPPKESRLTAQIASQ